MIVSHNLPRYNDRIGDHKGGVRGANRCVTDAARGFAGQATTESASPDRSALDTKDAAGSPVPATDLLERHRAGSVFSGQATEAAARSSGH